MTVWRIQMEAPEWVSLGYQWAAVVWNDAKVNISAHGTVYSAKKTSNNNQWVYLLRDIIIHIIHSHKYNHLCYAWVNIITVTYACVSPSWWKCRLAGMSSEDLSASVHPPAEPYCHCIWRLYILHSWWSCRHLIIQRGHCFTTRRGNTLLTDTLPVWPKLGNYVSACQTHS